MKLVFKFDNTSPVTVKRKSLESTKNKKKQVRNLLER